jgi:hypothetical protein
MLISLTGRWRAVLSEENDSGGHDMPIEQRATGRPISAADQGPTGRRNCKGVVQSCRFVKSAAHAITGGTSVKNDARIKEAQVVDVFTRAVTRLRGGATEDGGRARRGPTRMAGL